MSDSDPLADVVPFMELPKVYPQIFINKNTAGWLLRQRDRNGLAGIVRWVGRTPFVSRTDFAGWFRSRSEQPTRTAAQRAASAKNVLLARAARSRP